MACFRDDFQFYPLEFNPFDPAVDSQPDSLWGYETELQCHEVMFDTVFGIELIMDENDEYLWSGDSTGQSWVLRSFFVLKVYVDSAQTIGFIAQGAASFICRPDTNGEWYVWQWFDESEVKELSTWADIKMEFLR